MNPSPRIPGPPQAEPLRATHSGTVIALTLGISMIGLLGACSSVSDLTRERVAQSETSVQQAQQTVGQSEHGAVELQQATDKLNTAKSALTEGQQQQAEQSATQARLYAELAVAKSRSAQARKAADEVLTSLDTLRQETERAPSPQR
jgi:chromosome segregation ATPase